MFTTVLITVLLASLIFVLLSVTNTWPLPVNYSICIAIFIDVITLIQFVAHKILKQRNKTSINNALAERDKLIQDLKKNQFDLMEFIAQILGSHDLFTGRHVIHTQTYVELIAKKLKEMGYYEEELTDTAIEFMRKAAFLHDIGKIHIPEGLLNKNGKFTAKEFELMRCHPEEGAKLVDLLPIIDEGEFNRIAEEMALFHHEKWDGTGYPYHQKGIEIPLSARIMAAADVIDALLSQRLYKSPIPISEAIETFKKSSETHFEPCIVQAVVSLQDKIDEIDRSFKETEAATNEEELAWWNTYHEMMQNRNEE